MRKAAIVLLTLFLFAGLLHGEIMYLNMNTGESIAFNTSEINQITFSGDTSIEEMVGFIEQIPIRFLKNYPNPFNPHTTISFEIGQSGQTKVEIYNVKGQKVKTLHNDVLTTGLHSITWDGTSDQGIKTASGMYFYKVSVNNTCKTQKMLMLK